MTRCITGSSGAENLSYTWKANLCFVKENDLMFMYISLSGTKWEIYCLDIYYKSENICLSKQESYLQHEIQQNNCQINENYCEYNGFFKTIYIFQINIKDFSQMVSAERKKDRSSIVRAQRGRETEGFDTCKCEKAFILLVIYIQEAIAQDMPMFTEAHGLPFWRLPESLNQQRSSFPCLYLNEALLSRSILYQHCGETKKRAWPGNYCIRPQSVLADFDDDQIYIMHQVTKQRALVWMGPNSIGDSQNGQ